MRGFRDRCEVAEVANLQAAIYKSCNQTVDSVVVESKVVSVTNEFTIQDQHVEVHVRLQREYCSRIEDSHGVRDIIGAYTELEANCCVEADD